MGPKAEPSHDCEQPVPAVRVDSVPGSPGPDAAGVLQLEALVTEHHAALYRYAYRLAGSVHDAEDLTQQAFLVAREKLAQVRDAQHVRGWLCAVLRNCYLRMFRQQCPTPAATLGLNLDGFAEEEDDSPIDSEQLQAALGELPGDFRLVLLMFYFEELSYREIAEALAIPLGTVMSRLSRAKSCLRTLLRPAAPANHLPQDLEQAGDRQADSILLTARAIVGRPDPRRPEMEVPKSVASKTPESFFPIHPVPLLPGDSSGSR